MKRPIVLIVRHASLHALLFDRRRNVVWQANAEFSDAGALANAVSTLLLAAAGRARGRPVVALIGCAHAQLKMITGLPQIADVGVLTRIIGETPRRFFAVGGIATVTGLAERDETIASGALRSIARSSTRSSPVSPQPASGLRPSFPLSHSRQRISPAARWFT